MQPRRSLRELPLREIPLRELRDAALRAGKRRVASTASAFRSRRQEAFSLMRAKAAEPMRPLRTMPPSPERSLQMQERGLAWRSDLTHQHECRDGGREVVFRSIGGSSDEAWAAGNLLPDGTFAFAVRVACAQRSTGGLCCIGVCDADSLVAWGVHLGSGRLFRCQRVAATGRVVNGGPPFSPGFPDGHGTRVVDEAAIVAALDSSAGSVQVVCVVDSATQTLSIGLHGDEPRVALRNLPHGVSLRPWARLAHSHERATLEAHDPLVLGRGTNKWVTACVARRGGHRTQVV